MEGIKLTKYRKIMLFIVLPVLLALVFVVAYIKHNPEQAKSISATFEANTRTDTTNVSKTQTYYQEQQKKRQLENDRVVSNQSFYSVDAKPQAAPQVQPVAQAPAPAQATSSSSKSPVAKTERAAIKPITPRPAAVRKNAYTPISEEVDQVTGIDDDPEIIALKQLQAKQRAAGLKVTPIPQSFIDKKKKIAQLKGENKAQGQKQETVTTGPLYSNVPGKRTRGGGITNQSRGDLVPAVINEDQTIINGSRVRLRIQKDVVVNGVTIPRNTFVTGTANFNKTRASISLSSLIYNGSVIQFEKRVYDKDGLEGISLPENERASDAKDLSSDAISNATNGVVMAGSGVAGTVLSTARNFVTRKASQKTQKLHLKAGYQIYLR